ncbi:Formyltetrahydrofolate deformylase [Seminavis robusta]|uniref:Formyltetrahydrofolate deformylase n=1 Tax=Seminavis robusta TaxID=568900 RepID=A0A9N8ENQ5_9STRA|nr:Formyltetrahydrofolate deformylase [Seminavis robusta]|eukprot:Sro1406_g269910.1 Formyltetrahydrofolate deformylase (312) ;mRNA; f:15466-16486
MFRRSLPRFKSLTNLATLKVHGPDGKGIVAACCNLLDRKGYEIVGSEHWTDRIENLIFLRIAFDKEPQIASSGGLLDRCQNAVETADATEQALQQLCRDRDLAFQLNWRQERAKVAIMVSKYDHCLWELLLRHEADELDCDIVGILSNHDNLRPVAETFGIPYHLFPITKQNKREQERHEIQLLKDVLQANVVVLARYMQIFTQHFLQAFPNSIINIHHSFLPAFQGSRPHHAAFERGVKLIGATAHYATADLDEGPIIEQDVISVTHRDGVDGLIQKGRILERNVLARALQAHLDDRVIVYNNKCVVFGD